MAGMTEEQIMEAHALSMGGDRKVQGVFDDKFCDRFDARATIVIEFIDRIYGGLPMSGKPLEFFIKSKKMSTVEADELKARIQEGRLTPEESKEIDETCATVFERDREGFLCIWHGNLKACMREVLSTTGTFIKKKSKQGKNVFQHRTWIEPIRPRFLKQTPDGKWVPVRDAPQGELPADAATPDGTVEKVKIIRDMSGQRTALGRHEYLEHARLAFEWQFGFDNPAYTADDFEKAWFQAQNNGLGACRSQGQGRFRIVGWKWAKKPPAKKET